MKYITDVVEQGHMKYQKHRRWFIALRAQITALKSPLNMKRPPFSPPKDVDFLSTGKYNSI
jgi:hypothetical protein